MSFFEAPPPPPPREAWVAPAWHGPPDNTFGVPFPLSLVLARTESVAIQLHTGMAYSTGVEFTLQLLQREHRRDRPGDPIHHWHMAGRDDGEIDPVVLRFGVELSDGRKATVFDQHPRVDGEPAAAVLMQRGGGGGDRRYDMRFWLWPLPPAGQLAFVVEWPAQGIELTRHAVDTAAMREAAARVEELWPDGAPSTGSGSWTGHVTTAQRRSEPSK